jgi:CubicO group peptidase (beta-lactamase class C family)
MIRPLAATLALALALASSSTARSAALPKPPRTIDELQARIAGLLESNGIPGAGFALVTHDRVLWAGGVGFADRDARRPADADTLFRVGSITKSFIALSLLRLSEEGRLRLDARVADLAPEIAIDNPWAQEQPITVAHLLEHTAGFDEVRPNESFGPRSVESLPLADVLARNPRSRIARWRPGSRVAYANCGYTVAAYLIEKVTGRRFDDYIRDELFVPLGMRGSALRWSPDVERRLARGYADEPGPVPYRAIYHYPAGNLMTSPRELAALVQLYLARGRFGDRQLVTPAGIARMERSETSEVRGTDGDYGFANFGDVFERVRLRGHDGGIDGFQSGFAYSAERDVGFVFMINSTSERAGFAAYQLRHLLAEFLLRDAAPTRPPRASVPEDELRGWAGAYALANPRVQLFAFLERVSPAVLLSFDAGRLYLRRWPGKWPRVELVPMGDGRFRFPGASGSHVLLRRDTDGRRVVSLFGGLRHFVEEPGWVAPLYYWGARAVVWILASTLALPLAAIRARRRGRRVRWRWPTCSAVCFFAIPWLFFGAARSCALGERNLRTFGIFVLTIAFAVSAAGSALAAVRSFRDPVAGALKLHQLLIAVAACAAALFLASYGIIGIRLWQY